MKTIKTIPGEDPLELLRRCGGYYERRNGGPLVRYRGKDEKDRNYVGEIYANFAKIERHGRVLRGVARMLLDKFSVLKYCHGFCAAPEGGKALAVALTLATGKQYIFPEKKESSLVWNRHEPLPGESLWIVEDVCNNFSTTEKMIQLIESCDATIQGIVCFLNRSMTVEDYFLGRHTVLALVRKPIMEYEQDDPAVIADVQAGNIVLNPKDEWHKLVQE